MSGFAELAVTSNFSFLRSGSHPEEFVEQARALGLSAIGMADRCTLAGAVRAHVAAKEHGIRLIVGARLVFTSAQTSDVLAYPKDREAYGRLCRLLTLGNSVAPKGECHLSFEDFLDHGEGMQAIVAPDLSPGDLTSTTLRRQLEEIRARTGVVWLAAPFRFDGDDRRRLRLLGELADETGARLLATTEPLLHCPERRPLLDVLTCVREKTTLDRAGRRLAVNAERHLKPPEELHRLYASTPEAVSETERFVEGIEFSLDDLRYEYPDETSDGQNPQTMLETLAWEGAAVRYPEGVPAKVRETLSRELEIVAKLNYAPYFLTVQDIVRFARSPVDKDGNPKEPILCQGRGSAANSTICYCLGVTEVNPATNELLFDRFISEERNEPPDIDVDFEHERREEVIQYIYKKYGRSRAGLAATVISYRGRSAIREVGKAFGFSEDRIASLSKMLHWWSQNVTQEDLRANGLDSSDPRLEQCLRLAAELQGFPRHLSQHVGGFVMTRGRLDEVVPVQNAAMEERTVVEWDKDDLEALKILKVDVLGLGMLTCLKKAFDLIQTTYPDWERTGEASSQSLDLSTIPREDKRVYAMLQRADSIGVFQVESRAQMSMLPRLRPEEFYDLVIEVAIVRPGPIQGGMVHPYLRRKQGLDPISYPSKELEAVLKRTLGVPLFQEQAMQIAIAAAGFSPPEADKLRRAMATFKRVGTISQLKAKFINGMAARGYDRAFAERCFGQIEGFGSYGFPESHAASFALLVYASSWVKCHYPDVFAVALLNAQPMGFYAPAQIVRDAVEHGVEVRPVDVNHSAWDCTLEPAELKAIHSRHADMAGDVRSACAVRLGFRQIKGLRKEDMMRLVSRRRGGYDSLRDVWLRAEISESAIAMLADGDAFRSIGLDRRDALWAARALNRAGDQDDLPLFKAPSRSAQADMRLPLMRMGEHVIEDYRTLGLSLKAHPAHLLRAQLTGRGVIKAEALASLKNGARVRVAGLVLVRQRPGTASGVIFMTLEDETGVANIVVWPKMFERFRPEVLGSRLCAVDGEVQNERGVIHVIAEHVHNYNDLLTNLSDAQLRDAPARADETRRATQDLRAHPRKMKQDLVLQRAAEAVMPKGRNFH